MSFAGAAPIRSALNGVVCCPTCGLAAIVEGRIGLQGTGGPVGRLRISCIDGHGWLLLADRVRQVPPWEGLDDHSDPDVMITPERSEQLSLGTPGSAALPVDHRKAAQPE